MCRARTEPAPLIASDVPLRWIWSALGMEPLAGIVEALSKDGAECCPHDYYYLANHATVAALRKMLEEEVDPTRARALTLLSLEAAGGNDSVTEYLEELATTHPREAVRAIIKPLIPEPTSPPTRFP